jgi:hypothetical protein
MQKTYQYEDIEQMLAETDDLLQQIDPEIIEYMEEEQRAQREQQAQRLKELKSEVQDKIGEEGPSKNRPYSEGMLSPRPYAVLVHTPGADFMDGRARHPNRGDVGNGATCK